MSDQTHSGRACSAFRLISAPILRNWRAFFIAPHFTAPNAAKLQFLCSTSIVRKPTARSSSV